MAEIVLDVEVREQSGTGAARAVRREGKVPGVLYGGPRGPVSISVREKEFRKALYTGKLLGHLVTLKHGSETQPVIAKDVQFDPVSDRPVHFDLYRVDESKPVRIAVTVHFNHHDASPGLKRGGVLNIALHEVELLAPAHQIPEEILIDLTGLEIGDAVRIADLKLPEGVTTVGAHSDAVVATVTGSSAQASEDADADNAAQAAATPAAG